MRLSEQIYHKESELKQLRHSISELESIALEVEKGINALRAEYDALTPEEKLADTYTKESMDKHLAEIESFRAMSKEEQKKFAYEHCCRGCARNWGVVSCEYKETLSGEPYIDYGTTRIGYKGCGHFEWD